MSMHSMTYLFIFLLLAIVLIGGVFVAVRVRGGRIVASDHTADPNAPRPEGFGDSDRQRAIEAEGHVDPEVAP